jgi:hypothetical protein
VTWEEGRGGGRGRGKGKGGKLGYRGGKLGKLGRCKREKGVEICCQRA